MLVHVGNADTAILVTEEPRIDEVSGNDQSANDLVFEAIAAMLPDSGSVDQLRER